MTSVRLYGTLASLTLFVMLGAPLPGAAQQAFPTKTVRIIVPFPAGGTADVLPRIVAEKLSARWGKPVIVENRSGAGGNIGAQVVYEAEPDGHTLLSSPPGPLAINRSLYRKLPYDSANFVPITILASAPNVLAVHPSVPFGSVQELIDYAKANPEKITYASQGMGSTSHLTAGMFQSMTNTRMLHVPYKGTAPALTDLVGGQVNVFFDNLGSSIQYQRTGRLKILAVADSKRAHSLPDVPTIAEAGVPGFLSVTWFGVVAPPSTPDAVAREISRAFSDVIKMPDVANKFVEQGGTPMGGTPEETRQFIEAEADRWRKVIHDANVSLD